MLLVWSSGSCIYSLILKRTIRATLSPKSVTLTLIQQLLSQLVQKIVTNYPIIRCFSTNIFVKFCNWNWINRKLSIYWILRTAPTTPLFCNNFCYYLTSKFSNQLKYHHPNFTFSFLFQNLSVKIFITFTKCMWCVKSYEVSFGKPKTDKEGQRLENSVNRL